MSEDQEHIDQGLHAKTICPWRLEPSGYEHRLDLFETFDAQHCGRKCKNDDRLDIKAIVLRGQRQL
ncbi:hypothetical protein HW555_012812 [Spodoptera exigua]|uniref:Uncharacterized protein n=1 Tax=Spodoptera exigua TaxID=7107 RepID=A0A835G6E7_SPOEX|nr:hypothetical protein HW555_012812 [Spodoptera exigua]